MVDPLTLGLTSAAGTKLLSRVIDDVYEYLKDKVAVKLVSPLFTNFRPGHLINRLHCKHGRPPGSAGDGW